MGAGVGMTEASSYPIVTALGLVRDGAGGWCIIGGHSIREQSVMPSRAVLETDTAETDTALIDLADPVGGQLALGRNGAVQIAGQRDGDEAAGRPAAGAGGPALAAETEALRCAGARPPS